MQNYLSKLSRHKKFYSVHFLKKNQTFSLFVTVKMIANNAEICRVGSLETDFQQVLLVHFFWIFYSIVVKRQ